MFGYTKESTSVKYFNDVEPKVPPYIRPQGFGRLNPFYIDVSSDTAIGDFKVLDLHGVTWLWTLNEDNYVSIGAEATSIKAVKSLMVAFNINPELYTDYELQKLRMMGHASVAGLGKNATDLGNALDRGFIPPTRKGHSVSNDSGYGKAKFGGELVYDKSDKCWKVNNSSGRFGRLSTVGSLINIADYLSARLDMQVGVAR